MSRIQPDDVLLVAALSTAPRRYRMPPLPADADAAASQGGETALAFAIESARLGRQHGSPAPADLRSLFTRSLAELISGALARDPAFQALVARAQDPAIDEHVRLSAQAGSDRRAVRAAIDALAHPGKTGRLAAGATKDALTNLHRLGAAGSWRELGRAIEQLLARPPSGDEEARARLAAALSSPGLQRLVRGATLLELDAVRRYEALRGQRGPMAGSGAALAQGRASAHLGERAERATVHAFREIAGLLNGVQGAGSTYRVVRGLRTPRGFPGESGKAKEEWDAAIVRNADAGPADGGADIALLAEVKSSPAAATPDFSRLHRGLQRLAHASAAESYVFASADGDVRVTGESLHRLGPHGRSLPPNVIYCCAAPPESQPQVLSAAGKAVLLAEPASLAFARQLADGGAPRHADLEPVWDALTTAPRLRAALHQYDTACAVREAMLHPEDLLASVARRVASAS